MWIGLFAGYNTDDLLSNRNLLLIKVRWFAAARRFPIMDDRPRKQKIVNTWPVFGISPTSPALGGPRAQLSLLDAVVVAFGTGASTEVVCDMNMPLLYCTHAGTVATKLCFSSEAAMLEREKTLEMFWAPCIANHAIQSVSEGGIRNPQPPDHRD